MRVIKRDGREVDFDTERIRRAIESANGVMPENERLTAEDIRSLVDRVTDKMVLGLVVNSYAFLCGV